MLNDVVTIKKKHEDAATTLFDRVMLDRGEKYIIAISGEVGVGKCEIAHVLGRKLVQEAIHVKLLHMDNYYIIPYYHHLFLNKTPPLHYNDILINI